MILFKAINSNNNTTWVSAENEEEAKMLCVKYNFCKKESTCQIELLNPSTGEPWSTCFDKEPKLKITKLRNYKGLVSVKYKGKNYNKKRWDLSKGFKIAKIFEFEYTYERISFKERFLITLFCSVGLVLLVLLFKYFFNK